MCRIRRLLILGALLALVGCAQQPIAPPAPTVVAPPPAPAAIDAELTQAIARHRRLALDYRAKADHAAAAAQWQILQLLDPDDGSYAKELAATHRTIQAEAGAQLQQGRAAYAAGNLDRASLAMLRVLALEPGQPEAIRVLRSIDMRRSTRVQANRAARARAAEEPGPNAPTAPTAPTARNVERGASNAGDGYEIEQALEIFRAGDTTAGLRDLRAYVNAHPGNRPARQRIGGVVAERARELENKGAREPALALYEQATSLRGEGTPPWASRVASLKKAMSQDYYQQGSRAYRTDLAQAVRLLEKSVAYDPANTRAAVRLKEARAARDKLDRIGGAAAQPR